MRKQLLMIGAGLLMLTAKAQAAQLSIEGSAPQGSKVTMTLGYQSTEDSFGCTRLSLEDWRRVPKIIDLKYPMTGTAANFSLSAPDVIGRCSSRLISLPSIEVTLAGTTAASELGFKGSSISVEASSSDSSLPQKVVCKKITTSKGMSTSCSGQTVYMGPNLSLDLVIEEM